MPPKDHWMVYGYMDYAQEYQNFVKNYLVMLYYATLAFTLKDIGPQATLEIAVATFIFLVSVFYTAQIFAEFYVLRKN